MNKDHHQQLIQYVEEKLGRGKSLQWTNGDFEQLSAELRRETKVYISTATLKRIFGKVSVSEGYTPHRSTLEALETYVNFTERNQQDVARAAQQKKRRLGLILGLICVPILGAIVIGLVQISQSQQIREKPHGQLVLTKLEGKCPSTAFFELELDSLAGYLLRFGDDSPPLTIPPSTSYSYAHFYALPGYVKPELSYKGQILATTPPVLVETNDWQAFGYLFQAPPGKKPKRYYPLQIEENVSESIFHVSKSRLGQAGLDTTQILVVRLDHYAHTGVPADTFLYVARLKNDEFWPGVRCYAIEVQIQGTEGKIAVKLGAEGCSGFNRIILGDSIISDKLALLPLTVDVSRWHELRIENQAGEISLLINGQTAFKGDYTSSLGELLGTTVISHGSGKIDYVTLSAGGREVFRTPF